VTVNVKSHELLGTLVSNRAQLFHSHYRNEKSAGGESAAVAPLRREIHLPGSEEMNGQRLFWKLDSLNHFLV
jgi:hypothetical protein